MSAPSEVIAELAPAGVLRVALNHGNPSLSVPGPDGTPTGRAVDLATEVAARLGVAPRFIAFDAAAKIADVAGSDV